MGQNFICTKCGNAYRARKGFGSKCPKCQAPADQEQLAVALVLSIGFILFMAFLAATGAISWDQYFNGPNG